MTKVELKKLAERLIDTFNKAGEESIKLYDEGLKIEIIFLYVVQHLNILVRRYVC